MIDWRCSIELERTRINPDDIDGVCVIPREIEMDVFTVALEKAQTEKSFARPLQTE